jgi:hypothetical protein
MVEVEILHLSHLSQSNFPIFLDARGPRKGNLERAAFLIGTDLDLIVDCVGGIVLGS